MPLALEITLRDDGHATFRLPPADRPEATLVGFALDEPTGVSIGLVGRLDYLDEIPSLGRPSGPRSDAGAALEVYRRLGLEGLFRLEGEFALVLHDPADRRLIALRDPLGSWPLYYQIEGSMVRVGTSLADLARRSEGASIDLGSVASYVAQPFPVTELPSEATIYRSFRRVIAGTALALAPGRPERVIHRWDLDAQLSDLDGISPEAASEAFAGLLGDAVAQRIRRGPVASHFSGGMDSTTVGLLARDRLRARGERLSALSVVYDSPGLAGERDYIRTALDSGSPIDPFFMDGDSALDYDWFDRPIPDHDEPHPALFRLASERLLMAGAERSGSRTILTGAGADDLIIGDRLGLADLIRRGELSAAMDEAIRWARADNVSPMTVMLRHAVRPLIPPRFRDGLGPIFRGGYGRWPSPGQFTISPWIRPGFAREHRLRSRLLETASQAGRGTARGPGPSRAHWLRTTAGDWSTWYLGAPLGIANSHPFLDLRVLAFCTSLPRRVKEVPGRSKPVLADATEGLLPEMIRTRRRKCHFNAIYWNGLQRNLPALEAMVRGSRIAEWRLYDSEALIAAMRQHAMGLGSAMDGGRINVSLALIAWFDRCTSNSSGKIDQGEIRRSGQIPTNLTASF